MLKMRRFTAYVATSTALTVSIVAWALIDRPNFYSAAVYLSQSNACVLVLTNFCLLTWFLLIWALQRLFFGNLRALEIEALSERGWIVATEWLFAMSTFRGEFGVETAILFLLLIVGKAWGWICEGRIDTLDHQAQQQQLRAEAQGIRYSPHFGWVRNQGRLMSAVALNLYFAIRTLRYCAEEVMLLARPGVMMMFVFEWAILLMNATHIACKYAAWGVEQAVLQKQQKQRIEELRREAMAAAAAENNGEEPVVLERIPEEDLDVHDLDLPGWEGKGKFLFGLDILIDSLKVIAYLAFFAVLTRFYGLPFYILRDLYLSVRSLFKRLNDFIKYQKATANMNSRYPDATAQELSEDNTCIICREEMHPWHETAMANVQRLQEGEVEETAQPQQYSTSDRQRPKKLPCGHILHFYCLRSWLERQQTCPTCRRSVLDQQASTAGENHPNGGAQQHNHAHQAPQEGAERRVIPNGQNANLNAGAPGQPGNQNANNVQGLFQPGRGPLRIRFPGGLNFRMDENWWNRFRAAWNNAGAVPPPLAQAAGNNQQAPVGENNNLGGNAQGQQGQPQVASSSSPSGISVNGNAPGPSSQSQPQIFGTTLPLPHPAMEPLRPHLQSHIVHTQLAAIEAHLNMEMQSLQIAAHRAVILHQMQIELDRLRQAQGNLEARTMQVAMQIQQAGRPMESNQTAQAQPTTSGGQSLDNSIRLPPGYRLVQLGSVTSGQRSQATEPTSSSEPTTSTQSTTQNAQQATIGLTSTENRQPLTTATQPTVVLDPSIISATIGQMPNPTPTTGGFPAIPTPPPPTRSPLQQPQFGQPGQQQQPFGIHPAQGWQNGMPNGYNIVGIGPVGPQGVAQASVGNAANAITNAWMEHQARQRQLPEEASRLEQLLRQVALGANPGGNTTIPVQSQAGETSSIPEAGAVASNPADLTSWEVVADPSNAETLLHVGNSNEQQTNTESSGPTGNVEGLGSQSIIDARPSSPSQIGRDFAPTSGQTGPNVLDNLQPGWSFNIPEPSSSSNPTVTDFGLANTAEDSTSSEATAVKSKGKEKLHSNGSASTSTFPTPSESKNPTVEDVKDEDD